MFLLFILMSGTITRLLRAGAAMLWTSAPCLNQPGKTARNNKFVPQFIGEYLKQEGSLVTPGLTNIINEHRRETPNGPLFICIGETHDHSSKMADSIAEFFQAYSQRLTPEQRRNVVVTMEMQPNTIDEKSLATSLGLAFLERRIQYDPDDMNKVVLGARKADFRVVLVDSHHFAAWIMAGNDVNAREEIIYNNVNGLTQGLTNPTIFYYGGAGHCSKTPLSPRFFNCPKTSLATRLVLTHGNNSVISTRSVDNVTGFSGTHYPIKLSRDGTEIEQVAIPGDNPVIAPIGGPIRNEIGTYDYIITSPPIRT